MNFYHAERLEGREIAGFRLAERDYRSLEIITVGVPVAAGYPGWRVAASASRHAQRKQPRRGKGRQPGLRGSGIEICGGAPSRQTFRYAALLKAQYSSTKLGSFRGRKLKKIAFFGTVTKMSKCILKSGL